MFLFNNNQKPIPMLHNTLIIVMMSIAASGAYAQITKTTSTLAVFAGQIKDITTGKPLAQVSVLVTDDMLKAKLAETTTDANGQFSVQVPTKTRYRILTDKSTYFECDTVLNATSTDLVLAMKVKPGYIFDITIFDKAFEHNPINTLRDCKVEIYNNTTHIQELEVAKLPKSTFNFQFVEGNHYTMLVRKPGYLNRRVELYVNVNGCILCVDGMGIKEPDVVQLMQHGNELGNFLGTLDLDSIQLGKRFQLNNIYYDFNKSDIRSEAAKTLNKLATFLKDNPNIKIELGSHTDMRGSDVYNMALSANRAKAAVDYLINIQGIDADRVTDKGYGETQLMVVNARTEQEHQLNRRTEIKITGLTNKDPLWDKSLKEIIEDPNLYRKIIDQEKASKSVTSRLK
jgi:outer membrane protein OmpA-like peptidoglycan-associated protein